MKGDAVCEQCFLQGSVRNDTMQGDIHVDSVKGGDAIHEQGSIKDSMQSGTVQADTYVDSMKGDAVCE
eukprot:1354899-Alexandrium_andersonii.AAC.1